jgi:hypothetical protein
VDLPLIVNALAAHAGRLFGAAVAAPAPARVAGSSTNPCQQTVTVPTLAIVAPSPITDWGLALGANQVDGSLSVSASGAWAVVVSTSSPAAWRMAEYDGTDWVAGGSQLSSPLHVRVPAQGSDVSDGTSDLLATGSGSKTLAVEFDQQRQYGDPLPPATHTYHIIVTYTAFLAQ